MIYLANQALADEAQMVSLILAGIAAACWIIARFLPGKRP